MAAVPITFDGVLYDLYGRTTQRVIFIGSASLTGLGVGGGPIYPPPGGGGGGGGDHIWGGGNEPFPTPPIAFPPGWVGGVPPEWGTWPPQRPPHPAHPIITPPPVDYPKPPEGQPDDNGFIKAPPAEGGWGYHEDYGWMYKPAPTEPGPKTATAAPPKK